MKRLHLILVLGVLTIGWGFSVWAEPKTIALPVSLDYPSIVRSVI